MKRKWDKKTIIFLCFMILFFLTAAYLTYYSGEVYLKNLPKVVTQMPEASGEYLNGRMTYFVPAEAIHKDITNGNFYVLTARYTQDVLGERYVAVRTNVWIVEETKEGRVRVDGIVWEEPILVGTGDTIMPGDAIFYQK